MKKIIVIIVAAGLAIGLGVVLSKTQNKSKADGSTKVTTGHAALDFSLRATNGETITLSQFKGKQNVLIFFHEGLSCDPCMQQIPALEKRLDEFDKMNVAVLNVSGVDTLDQLRQSLERYGIQKSLVLSYTNAKTDVTYDYDLLPFSMGMGKRAGHTFILVGTDGIIKWRKDYWPDYGMTVSRGVMFVESDEIIKEVKTALGKS